MENINTVDSKIVFRAFIARNLLKMGNKIIDIKADKNNKERTIFVFENTEKFRADLATILDKKKEETKTQA